MTLDQLLKQVSQTTCPRQIDVADSVVAAVANRPYMRLTPVRWWPRVAASVAAVAVLLIAVNVVVTNLRPYNETQIGDMLSLVHEYNTYGSFQSVENVAVNPLEQLYEDFDLQ